MAGPVDVGVLDRSLDAFIESAGEQVPAVVMRVEQPTMGVRWSGARGVREVGGEPARADDGFRVASVAKTLTAAAVIVAAESGHVELGTSVVGSLPAEIRVLLDAVGVDEQQGLTFERLLNHTSGLHDFGTDREYYARVGSEPSHRWDAAELVELSMRRGPMVAAPGERFHYSDTGYTLLASALEAIFDRPLPEIYRAVLDRGEIELPATWLEGREPVPIGAPPRMHQYLDGNDTFDLDPSCDTWGGGGLVSTCADLAVLITALFDGRIIRDPELLRWMLTCDTPTDLGDHGAFCGRGVFRTPVAGTHRFGHEGFWGVWMHHVPDLDLTITGVHTGTPVDPDARMALFTAPVRSALGATS